MQEVLDILEELDVNSCRIRCEFDPKKELAGGSKQWAEALRESGFPEASPRS